MKERDKKSNAERIIERFDEDKMKREVNKEVKMLLEEARRNPPEIKIERKLKVQHSKQFFVRFPKDLEEAIGLEKGKDILFTIKVNPKDSDKKIDVNLEVK